MNTLELTIERRYFKSTYCIGKLFVEGMPLCDTLEDKDRGLTQNMPTAEIYKKKTYGQTAIPYGRYEVRLTYSPKYATRSWAAKYKGLIPEILEVPGFSNVRLHVGNSSADTSGCPLCGENKVVGRLVNSTQAFYDLMDYYLLPAHEAGQRMFITIMKV